MKALRFTRFGDPDVLTVEDLPDPIPGPDEARVRIQAASINPSDAKNVAGAMSQTTLPRIPGRDYAGIVDAGPDQWIGAEVWGSGNAGFTRDGSHAQYMIVPVASLRRKPTKLSFDQASCVGVNFLAAWRGLVDAAKLREGETVVIIGASGGVGTAVAQVARRVGAIVIGVDRYAPHPASAVAAAVNHMIVGAQDVPAAVRAATSGEGADVVYDAVGGPMFRPALDCLRHGGRVIAISATGQRDVSFDLLDFYHNESRLFGVDTLQLDLTDAADILEALRPGFESGDYRPAPIARSASLEEAVAAYQAVLNGERGRLVLRPNG